MKKLVILIMVIIALNASNSLKPFNRCPSVAFGNNPQTSVIINYGTKSPEITRLSYTHNGSDSIIAIDSALTCDHQMLLESLKPGITYSYRINEKFAGTFSTENSEKEDFSFIVFGDNRTNHKAHEKVVNRIIKEGGFSFVLNVGDMVYDGRETSEWERFFEIEAPLLSNSVFMPAKGNHDMTTTSEDNVLPKYFGIDNYGSFDYRNVHFIRLDLEGDCYNKSIEQEYILDQVRWLRNDLDKASENPDIKWIVVWQHRPVYSSGVHGDSQLSQEFFVPLFEDYGVDFVLAGHDHCYERSNEINGVTYITTGGGGAPLYKPKGSEHTASMASKFHFVKFDIKNDTLHYRAIDIKGRVIDHFEKE